MASFFVRDRKTKWILFEQSYEDTKSIQKAVDKSAYLNLGFDPSWPLQKARERCKLLNKQNKQKRKESHKIAAVSQRVTDLKLLSSIYLPEELAAEFHTELMSKSFGSVKHQSRIHSHWKFIQVMVKDLKIEPQSYSDGKERFYRYFLDRSLSPDYVNKLLRILNMYGAFACKRLNLSYTTVPIPRDHTKNRIAEAYQDDPSYIGPNDPLTPEMLEKAKSKVSDINYRWLYISIWFGLRPNEIDSLLNDKTWKVSTVNNVEVLHIYQSKLTSVSRDKRWKHIPVLYKEQVKALEFIKSKSFKRPTRYVLENVFKPKFIRTYAGRKGFVDLMLQREQPLEAISSWLGHQDISITWKKYRNMVQVLLGKKIG